MLDAVAIRVASAGDVGHRLPPGVTVLDRWIHDSYAGVLFWVGREFDVWGAGENVLHSVILECSEDFTWTAEGCGAVSSERPEKRRAGAPGLHKVSGLSGDPVRLSAVIASSEVAAIRLVSDYDETERPVGVEGICLLGITHHDPITYASAVNDRREAISANRLLL